MELIVYSTPWCSDCREAKRFLDKHKIAYKEIDIESNGGAASYAQAGGQRGVPLLFKNGQRVLGFSTTAYDALLSAKN